MCHARHHYICHLSPPTMPPSFFSPSAWEWIVIFSPVFILYCRIGKIIRQLIARFNNRGTECREECGTLETEHSECLTNFRQQ
uniref:Uncharacterized protein n=1 Tax=Romanomermis culicivorax TaxID=13658 RepID=A0A915KG08_ROMCU